MPLPSDGVLLSTLGDEINTALQDLSSADRTALVIALISNTTAGEAESLALAIAALLTGLSEAHRGAFLADMSADMIGVGEVWRTTEDGLAVDGVLIGADEVATQQDILTGTDVDKVITAESVGGLMLQRTITYAATVDIDFTGTTPAWSFENLISCTGALAIQADTFPSYMVGKEFSIQCVRASGTGDVTVQNQASNADVEFRDDLVAGDIPPLGTTAGDSVTIRAKVMATNLWRVEAVESVTA